MNNNIVIAINLQVVYNLIQLQKKKIFFSKIVIYYIIDNLTKKDT